MPQRIESWSIPGSDGQPIIGDAHFPDGEPRGVIVVAHGFKGYKDYGMFPRIAAECARAGLIAHRFNFSHSGMTNNIDTFERPDLFEKDTWNKQVFDLRKVVEYATAGSWSSPAAAGDPGRAATQPQPLFLLGHSRGGVTAILTLGRHAEDPTFPNVAGLITLAAPSTACSLSEYDQEQLLREGRLDSPSSRTGQTLRIGKAFLQEQLDDPENHDVLAMAARITGPMLVIHGENDPTVPARAAHEIAKAARENGAVHIVPGGDHVFITPNPFPAYPPPEASAQLRGVLDRVAEFTAR